ncbi:MAG: hypothetical protein AAB767_02215 [Patescibacteria group bacterium]
MNATETETKIEPHKLDNTILLERSLWRERLKEWNRPMSFDDRRGWLRVNLVRLVRADNDGTQFIFGMEVADRYGEPAPETGAGSKKCIFTLSGYNSIGELKKRLSQEAFAVICKHYFEKRGFLHILPYQEPLFSTLLWFFRPYGGFGGWDNLRPHEENCLGKDGGRHYLEVARAFAEEFALNAWALLNKRCFVVSDSGSTPEPTVATPHWWKIVLLLCRLRMLHIIKEGRYVPRPEIFNKLLEKLLTDEAVVHTEADLTNEVWVARTLEPLVQKGTPLAESLYIARLHLKRVV